MYVETKELMTSLGNLGSPSQQILRLMGSISSMIEAEDQPKLKIIVLCTIQISKELEVPALNVLV